MTLVEVKPGTVIDLDSIVYFRESIGRTQIGLEGEHTIDLYMTFKEFRDIVEQYVSVQVPLDV